jgi:phosphatidylserine/phosphatidylglycerophosphate/cardiolipin synthase-like enzyme
MTIQPLLTPDRAADDRTGMYAEKMLDLISNAQSSLYIQLQYIHPSNRAEDEAFTELLNAVAARAAAGVDVRITLSQWQNTQWMERLRAAGINTDLVRIQQGVHNKGFVVDHRKTVVSSQNWSGAGVLENRDAGLIIDNATIAQYLRKSLCMIGTMSQSVIIAKRKVLVAVAAIDRRPRAPAVCRAMAALALRARQ